MISSSLYFDIYLVYLPGISDYIRIRKFDVNTFSHRPPMRHQSLTVLNVGQGQVAGRKFYVDPPEITRVCKSMASCRRDQNLFHSTSVNMGRVYYRLVVETQVVVRDPMHKSLKNLLVLFTEDVSNVFPIISSANSEGH